MDKINKRGLEIINNMIYEILTKTEFPKEQMRDWLITEIGMSSEEVNEFETLYGKL